MRKYGITEEQVTAMRDAQDNRCGVCLRPEHELKRRGFVVDHCHTTGVVRGLLCDNCNKALGLLYDDPEVMRRAAEYILSSPQEKQTP